MSQESKGLGSEDTQRGWMAGPLHFPTRPGSQGLVAVSTLFSPPNQELSFT